MHIYIYIIHIYIYIISSIPSPGSQFVAKTPGSQETMRFNKFNDPALTSFGKSQCFGAFWGQGWWAEPCRKANIMGILPNNLQRGDMGTNTHCIWGWFFWGTSHPKQRFPTIFPMFWVCDSPTFGRRQKLLADRGSTTCLGACTMTLVQTSRYWNSVDKQTTWRWPKMMMGDVELIEF